MRWLLVPVLSFFCIVDFRFPEQRARNEALGCETFSAWRNALEVERYWIQHCPDTAWAHVESSGVWTPGRAEDTHE